MKPSIITLSVLLLLGAEVQAQQYKEMMDDLSVNFYEVVESAEAYFADKDKGKGSGYNPYMRWRANNEPLYYPSGDRLNIDTRKISAQALKLRQSAARMRKSSSTTEWTELGPSFLDSITAHYAPGLGRVEAVWADDNNGDTLYCSSRSGGWWRSYDSGSSWQNTTDNLPVTGVNTFSVNPVDDQNILINNRNALNGATHGIYRSDDGGSTWTITAFEPGSTGLGGFGDNASVGVIRHHPANPDTILIATSDGLWRSSDGLLTVSNVYNQSISDVRFHPTDDDIAYMTRSGGGQRNDVYKSTDGGLTWSISESIAANSNSSMKLHTMTSYPTIVITSSGNGVFRSEDEGTGFRSINIAGTSGSTFAVSDIDPRVMLRGVLDIYRTNDDGNTWPQATEWYLPSATADNYVHADFRSYYAINGVFYIGTDGFMCKSTDNGVTWSILTDDTSIREYYKLGLSQSHKAAVSVGSQDNGSSYYRDGTWYEWIGADGMEQIVHPSNPDWVIGCWQYGGKRRSTNAAQSHSGINGHTSLNLDWIAPLAYDPIDAGTIYTVGDKLVRSDDWGSNWTTLHDFGATCNRMAIAENGSDLMIVTDREDIYRSTDRGASFSQIGLSMPNFFIADVAFDPSDDQTFAILYDQWQDNNQRIYITHDGGNTFQNISYNLSAIPGRSIVIDHTVASNIYVGTEAGVFYMPMGGTSYSMMYSNLPPVAVRELEIHYGSNTLMAATWGRGLWQAPLVGRADYPQILEMNSDVDLAVGVGTQPTITVSVDDGDAITTMFMTYSVNNLSLGSQLSMMRVADKQYITTGTLPANTTGDMVHFKIYAVNASGDTTETYRYNYEVNTAQDYCAGQGSTGTGSDYITEVSVNGLTNTSGKNQYTNFGNVGFSAEQYDSVAVEIQLNFSFAQNDAGAWIDWNDDKVFAPEEAIEMGAYNSSHIATGLASIPAHVTPGSFRLRVRNSWSTTADPCGTVAGEVEDYDIEVTSACPSNSVVTNTSDGLVGSLRFWIDRTCVGDTIFFDQELLADTLTIYNSPLSNAVAMTIYGHDSQNFTISGDSTRQLMIINQPTNLVNLNLVNANGAAPTGGALINNSTLTLRRVTLEHNKEGNSPKPLTNNGVLMIEPGVSEVKE